MRTFDRRLMELSTFLTRRQAWLTPQEIAADFRLDGKQFTSRTIHNWFSFLRSRGFVYYPYPKANQLGLQEVLVTVHGLREPRVCAILPFGASFSVDVGLETCEPAVNQGYWVPGSAMPEFREFWESVKDFGLAREVDVFESKNRHFIFSPFEEVRTESGSAVLDRPADNAYFGRLIARNLRERYEVKLAPWFESSPFLIPIVLEHIWECASSRQVWRLIRARGEADIRRFVRGRSARALESPGSALRLVQQRWRWLQTDFEKAFLQPRLDYGDDYLRNALVISFAFEPGSTEATIEAALELSNRAISTVLRPGSRRERTCHILSLIPGNQLVPILALAREYNGGKEPPRVSVRDTQVTDDLFDPAYCKVDWRLFDPSDLSWRFHIEDYLNVLENFGGHVSDEDQIIGRAKT